MTDINEHPTKNPGVHGQTGSRGLLKSMAGHPFFYDMKAAHLRALAGCAMLMEFDSDTLILRQGDVASRFYLLQTGRVALESKRPDATTFRIQTLEAGDALGWSWLFPPHVWRFSARAIEPTKAIFFYGTWMRELCHDHPGLGGELWKRLTQVVVRRLQATQKLLTESSQAAARPASEPLQIVAAPHDTHR